MHGPQLVLLAVGLSVGMWVLHQIGKGITKLLEAAAAIGAVLLAVWLAVKGLWWVARQVVAHWRCVLAIAATVAWCGWWGWLSLVVTLGAVAVVLLGWRLLDVASFEPWVGRRLRGWWQRWMATPRDFPAGCGRVG